MLADRIDRSPYPYLLLALISLLATALRLYRLGEWSFWIDEVYTVRAAYNLLDGYGLPKLSMLLISTLLRVTEASEWSMRLIPALTGILTVPLLFLVTRKLFGRPVALAASLLLALSPWHLYWSQNARFYSMQLLLYLLLTFFYYLGIRQNRASYLVGAALFFFLAALERQTSFMFVPVAFLYLTIRNFAEFRRPRRFVKHSVPLVIPILAYGVYAGPDIVPHFIETFIGRANHSPWRLFLSMVYSIGIPIFSLALAGGGYLLRQRTSEGLFLVLSAAVPFLVLLCLSPFAFTVDRYIFVAFPYWIILAAVALVETLSRLATNGRVLALGVLLIVLSDLVGQNYLYFNHQNGNRPNWRGAFEVIERKRQSGDVIVTKRPELGAYYLGETPLHVDRVDHKSLAKDGRTIWFIEDIDWANPAMEGWVKRHSTLIRVLDVHLPGKNLKMRVYRYDPTADIEVAGQ